MSLARMKDISFSAILRSFQIAYGLAPQYLKALFLTLVYGRNKKPRYKVTLKEHRYGVYTHLVVPQLIIIVITLLSIYWEISGHADGLLLSYGFNLSQYSALLKIDWLTISWGIVHIFMTSRIVLNSVWGISLFKDITTPKVKRAFSKNVAAS
jgi:hypothetical protein